MEIIVAVDFLAAEVEGDLAAAEVGEDLGVVFSDRPKRKHLVSRLSQALHSTQRHLLILSHHQTTLLHHHATLLHHQATLLHRQVTLPHHLRIPPHHQATPPPHQATLPHHQSILITQPQRTFQERGNGESVLFSQTDYLR